MELGDIVGKYGTQLKEKITDIYDNNKRKIQATILGSSLLCTSGCGTLPVYKSSDGDRILYEQLPNSSRLPLRGENYDCGLI